jgi:hypothetical protein
VPDLVYLASPYSNPDPAVRIQRFEEACKAAGYLMKQGLAVFSPIAHSHSIEMFFDKIEPGPFWMKQDIPVLRHCSRMYILALDGWTSSKGIAEEIEVAEMCKIPISTINPLTYHTENL